MQIPLNTFMATLFSGTTDEEHVCLARPAGKGFIHEPYVPSLTLEPPASWYACVATVNGERSASGNLRRRKENLVRAHVVMLDDIGTKVGVPPVPPTAILETSQGNDQYLYAIEPYDLSGGGLARYEEAVKLLAEGGFSDPGASGAGRLFRVPGSLNTKGDSTWTARLKQFHPSRQWTFDGLMDAFGVEIPEMGAEYMPSPGVAGTQDKVADWLIERGLVTDERDDVLIVPCPWQGGHTQGDGMAAYMPLGRGSRPAERGFKCLHGHCAARTTEEYLTWVAAQDGAPQATVLGSRDLAKAAAKFLVSPESGALAVKDQLPKLNAGGMPDLKLGAKGGLMSTQPLTSRNVEFATKDLGLVVRYNIMERRIEVHPQSALLVKLAEDNPGLDLRRMLMDELTIAGVGVANRIMTEILSELGNANRYNPMEDWIKSVPWDGKKRIGMLGRTVEVTSKYESMWPVYLKHWLVQGVQAACGWRDPQQVGSVLGFSGDEELGKTRWFASLVPDGWYNDSVQLNLNGNRRDSVQQATMTPIAELGELDGTFRKSDNAALKAFLTSVTDTHRQLYVEQPMRLPRATVFVSTVNRPDFLHDEGGNRRYWALEVTGCNPAHGINMQQVWAEAYTLWESGVPWYLPVEHRAAQKRLTANFLGASAVADKWGDYAANTALVKQGFLWQGYNVTRLAEELNLSTDKKTLGELTYLVDREVGPRKTSVKGVQRAWLLPPPNLVAQAMLERQQERLGFKIATK